MYAPNAEKLRLLLLWKKILNEFKNSSNDENVILVSDLNCDTTSKKDKSSKLKDKISKFSFIDL